MLPSSASDRARSILPPVAPDSEYGWEKLFSERLYLSYYRNYGIQVRVARFRNIFGPEGAWCDGREKSPAALCRKVAQTKEGGEIEIWVTATRLARSYMSMSVSKVCGD